MTIICCSSKDRQINRIINYCQFAKVDRHYRNVHGKLGLTFRVFMDDTVSDKDLKRWQNNV